MVLAPELNSSYEITDSREPPVINHLVPTPIFSGQTKSTPYMGISFATVNTEPASHISYGTLMSEFVADQQVLRGWDDVFRAADFVELVMTVRAEALQPFAPSTHLHTVAWHRTGVEGPNGEYCREQVLCLSCRISTIHCGPIQLIRRRACSPPPISDGRRLTYYGHPRLWVQVRGRIQSGGLVKSLARTTSETHVWRSSGLPLVVCGSQPSAPGDCNVIRRKNSLSRRASSSFPSR
jgi:hypothetical protein